MYETLEEILCQIDPYVKLFNGFATYTVKQWLEALDPLETSSAYVIRVDSVGRLLVHRIDDAGQLVYPAELIEIKNTQLTCRTTGHFNRFVLASSLPTE